jgi:hypothetical protein
MDRSEAERHGRKTNRKDIGNIFSLETLSPLETHVETCRWNT